MKLKYFQVFYLVLSCQGTCSHSLLKSKKKAEVVILSLSEKNILPEQDFNDMKEMLIPGGKGWDIRSEGEF